MGIIALPRRKNVRGHYLQLEKTSTWIDYIGAIDWNGCFGRFSLPNIPYWAGYKYYEPNVYNQFNKQWQKSKIKTQIWKTKKHFRIAGKAGSSLNSASQYRKSLRLTNRPLKSLINKKNDVIFLMHFLAIWPRLVQDLWLFLLGVDRGRSRRSNSMTILPEFERQENSLPNIPYRTGTWGQSFSKVNNNY